MVITVLTPIVTLSPIVTPPIIFVPAPINTLLPIVALLPIAGDLCPIRTPGYNVQFSPILVFPLITI